METPFIKKLRKILDNSDFQEIICWAKGKTVIQIRDQKLFEEKVLSQHFRHKRMASFVRQLNLYGFRKIRSAQLQTFTHAALENGEGIRGIAAHKKKNENDLENQEEEVRNIPPQPMEPLIREVPAQNMPQLQEYYFSKMLENRIEQYRPQPSFSTNYPPFNYQQCWQAPMCQMPCMMAPSPKPFMPYGYSVWL